MAEEFQKPVVAGATIKKAVLKGFSLQIEYDEHLTDGTTDFVRKNHGRLVHEDLIRAFNNLVPHLIILCDQKEASGIKEIRDVYETDPRAFEEYTVTGFVLSKAEDAQAVTLIGKKKIGKKRLNLISPLQKYYDGYEFSSQLETAVDSCYAEVEEYMKGKCALPVQEEEEESEETAQPALES